MQCRGCTCLESSRRIRWHLSSCEKTGTKLIVRREDCKRYYAYSSAASLILAYPLKHSLGGQVRTAAQKMEHQHPGIWARPRSETESLRYGRVVDVPKIQRAGNEPTVQLM